MHDPFTPTDQQTSEAPVTVVPVKRRSNGRWMNALVALAVLVFVGGMTFAIGRATAPAQAANAGTGGQFPTNGQFPSGSFNPGGFPGGGLDGGGRTISGTVASISGTTMTLTTANGQTLTVDLSGTTYHAQTAATASDVTAGASVQVTVEGFGGPGGNSGAQPSAAPSGASSGQSATATDVTIVSQ